LVKITETIDTIVVPILSLPSKDRNGWNATNLEVPPFPMIDEGRDRAEAGATLEAKERPLAGVDDHVDLKLLRPGERLGTVVTLERAVA